MSKIRGFVLLFSILLSLNSPLLIAQESRVTPGRPIVAPRFEMDVLVEGRPLPEFESRGRTYVEALRGEEYEIRLRNRSSDYVAVALYVDGLNTIDSSRTSPSDASKWVIEPYDTITISGWQMDSDHARRFYFTSERDSYAARLGVTSSLGTIRASFYRERRRLVTITPPHPLPRRGDKDSAQSGPDLSSAEAPSAGTANKSRARDEAATGIGRSIHHDVRYVDMELESRPAAEVTICYDYGRFTSESNPKYRVRGKSDN